MRKAIFIFIAIILVAVSIDWIDACSEVKTDKEMFKRNLTQADMYEYKDSAYDFYSKFIRNGKFWFVYTMLYPDRYQDVLTRLFKEIDDWQIWECPHLQLKQGENQTPRDSFWIEWTLEYISECRVVAIWASIFGYEIHFWK